MAALDADRIGGLTTTPEADGRAFVNGVPVPGDPAEIALRPQQHITLTYGPADQASPHPITRRTVGRSTNSELGGDGSVCRAGKRDSYPRTAAATWEEVGCTALGNSKPRSWSGSGRHRNR
ncbi:hypothetical protein GCM10027597_32320 [Saccharopolyspora tripterygii]